MIKGLGTDLVEIARIKKIYERWGAKFTAHLLAAEEFEFLPQNPVIWLAGRFAAKEAAAKALGTGFQNGVHWQDLLILSDNLGKPELHMRGPALELAEKMGVRHCHLSISHEREMACAVLIMED